MASNLRKCSRCGQAKPPEEFRPKRLECKDCSRARCRAYREALKAKDPKPNQTAGVISLKDAAKICQEITGYKISATFIRGQAYNFPQIAAWDIRPNGGNHLVGIIEARLIGLVKGRQVARGRFAELKDIFSTVDI